MTTPFTQLREIKVELITARKEIEILEAIVRTQSAQIETQKLIIEALLPEDQGLKALISPTTIVL